MNSTHHTQNVFHATASPGGDASRAHPVAGAENFNFKAGINIKKSLFIGCWNVRTLMDIGSQTLTLRALYDYQVDITCLSEVRIPGSGSRSLKIPGASANYWLYHSGPEDNSGQYGVAFALSPRAHKSLLSWNPISSRIALARFKGHPFNLTVVSVYAPTLPSDTSIKDEFYCQLQDVVNEVSKRDILIIAGDWNARTGQADDYTRHILGKFGLGQRCDNGDRLINFADANRMFIASTRFQHPRKHLLTWYSNDGITAHQLDHILIRSRWISSIEDCRSYRGAEAGNKGGSDHVLVRAKLRLHLANRTKTRRSMRVNVAALSDPGRCLALKSELSERLTRANTVDRDEIQSVDSRWLKLKSATQTAVSSALGTTSHRQKDWITSDTLRLSNLAKQARLNNLPDYRTLRRAATRSARKDRNQYWKNMAETMEEAANANDFGKLFRLIRSGSGKHQGFEPLLRNSEGQLIPTLDGKIARWVEHFSQLFNHPAPQSPPVACIPGELYNVNCDVPTKEEISRAINSMKNKKAPGEDGIPAEVFKACETILLGPLHELFCSIWESETFPSDWDTSILLPFPKKGDRTVCENYRGISLLNVATKIF